MKKRRVVSVRHKNFRFLCQKKLDIERMTFDDLVKNSTIVIDDSNGKIIKCDYGLTELVTSSC